MQEVKSSSTGVWLLTLDRIHYTDTLIGFSAQLLSHLDQAGGSPLISLAKMEKNEQRYKIGKLLVL